jgi:hypothetical protein
LLNDLKGDDILTQQILFKIYFLLKYVLNNEEMGDSLEIFEILVRNLRAEKKDENIIEIM